MYKQTHENAIWSTLPEASDYTVGSSLHTICMLLKQVFMEHLLGMIQSEDYEANEDGREIVTPKVTPSPIYVCRRR